ncbi:MAG: hypothetical protein ABI821_05935 [Pseudomonadota bacterium]
MDAESLALKLMRMQAWMEQPDAYPQYTRQQFDAAPGAAQISVDPTSTEAAASFNRNRIILCGRSGELTHDDLLRFIEIFRASGVRRFFAWLSPGPERDTVRGWLESLRMQRVVWTRYPTLTLSEPANVNPITDFTIRTVNRAQIVAAREQFGFEPMAGFEQSADRAGFRHYLAFEGPRPIASAALVQFERIGYLTYAQTNEADRERGAQSALIVRRSEDARRLGCTCIATQTLTMLERSLSNLQRCGFREVYEQEVYEGRA